MTLALTVALHIEWSFSPWDSAKVFLQVFTVIESSPSARQPTQFSMLGRVWRREDLKITLKLACRTGGNFAAWEILLVKFLLSSFLSPYYFCLLCFSRLSVLLTRSVTNLTSTFSFLLKQFAFFGKFKIPSSQIRLLAMIIVTVQFNRTYYNNYHYSTNVLRA